jgi:heptose II phosphotransferase
LGHRVVSNWTAPQTEALMQAVLSNALAQAEVLRNSRHSRCVRFEWGEQTLLLKVPTARNTRRWERFLSLWRGSESWRIFSSMARLRDMGFHGPEPVLCAEVLNHRMVRSSFVVYVFLQGRPVGADDVGQVSAALSDLHQMGWTRNDARAVNFLMLPDGQVGWIDFKLKRSGLFKSWHTAMELAQFIHDSPQALAWLSEHHRLPPAFALARRLHRVSQYLRDLRRSIKLRWKAKPPHNG